MRMDNICFNIILNKIKEQITKKDTNMRQCILAEKQLAVTLRFLATGETYRSLMYSSRIHETTIGLIVPKVCTSIYNALKDDYLMTPKTVDEWRKIADDFGKVWNFPLCIGAIDGKHINFRPPRSEESYYYNYKGNHSIILLALVDASYKFIYIDVGVNGRISDGGVFRESTLREAMVNGSLNIPPDTALSEGLDQLPYVIVADDAFPLSRMIVKPYPQRNSSHDKRIFNYRLSRARRVVENAFGILANRFRILLTTINLNPDKVETITLTCCVLNNFLATERKSDYTEENILDNGLNGFTQQNGNNASREAFLIRDAFKEYFNTVGSVAWQEDSIKNHQG